MQLALRPYVTTGVAIVGASVIAVAPIVPTPTDIQIPNPLIQVDRPVQLTAGVIEDTIDQVTFLGAQIAVTLAKLPAPLLAPILGVSEPVAELILAGATLGLLGPLISGPGGIGIALQDIVDQLGSFDIAGLLNTLIGAPATVIGGFVNGGVGVGPDLDPLLLDLGFPNFAGGLINPGALTLAGAVLPGLIPTLQGLVEQMVGLLTSQLGGGDMMAAALVSEESEGQIEGAVNFLLFNLVASPIVTVAGLLGQILTPVIGEEEAALLPLAALGLFGPLISGPGAVGTAIQDVVDSLGSGDFAGVLNALIGAPATVIDGVVNGGHGPSLTPLVGPILFPGVPVGLLPKFLAGGLINVEDENPPIVLPGTIPTLQALVGQILDLVGLNPQPEPPSMMSSEVEASSTKLGVDTLTSTDPAPKGPRLFSPPAPDKTTDNPVSLVDVTVGVPSGVNLPAKAEEITTAIENTEPRPGRAEAVSEAAGKPDTAPGKPTVTDTLDTTDGAKFEPETTVAEAGDNGDKKAGGDSNPVGATISSVAKGFAGAVKSALGG